MYIKNNKIEDYTKQIVSFKFDKSENIRQNRFCINWIVLTIVRY